MYLTSSSLDRNVAINVMTTARVPYILRKSEYKQSATRTTAKDEEEKRKGYNVLRSPSPDPPST